MKRILVLLSLAGLVACTSEVRTDVLVVGGGASGVCAAVQAARMGVKTVVLEEGPWIGGMLTSAGVSCVDGNYNLRGGLFGEFADSLAVRYGGWDALKTGWVSNINFEPQVGQEILTNIAAGCGEFLDVRRQVRVLEVSKEDGKWHVLAADLRGRERIYVAEVLIDGTELGDIARMCGVDYRIGMDSSSETGESIAPEEANDVIQDLTYVAFLKDYGPEADMTIPEPEGYDPTLFYNCAVNPRNTVSETGQTIWPAEMMITYGRTPGGRYMINWPIYGNDHYANTIDMTPQERAEAYKAAKNFTLCFVHFIQTGLGMKNLGIADDVFPTEDGLALMPYHRESRRIAGEAFLTVDAVAKPYDYKCPYYRTGIAVGDYAVDHHHFRHPEWKSLPDLHFYPVPSFNVPAGVMIPAQEDVDNLIVAEKSVSVSNLINGATRLQPVVMQIGQAAGAMAAQAVQNEIPVRTVSIRTLQEELLDAGCYIMPFLDLDPDDEYFDELQRIGATGVMRGEGRNVGWSNQTWFRAGDPLLAEELYLDEFFSHRTMPEVSGTITVGELMSYARAVCDSLGYEVLVTPNTFDDKRIWEAFDLSDYRPERPATRLEAAVVIDNLVSPFDYFEVDFHGNLIISALND